MLPDTVARRCSVTKLFLGNLAKFTEKHLCQSLFFNKVSSHTSGGCFCITYFVKNIASKSFLINCDSRQNIYYFKHSPHFIELCGYIHDSEY